jgi:hypothetical protein
MQTTDDQYSQFKARFVLELYDAIRNVPRESQVDALCEWLMLSAMRAEPEKNGATACH